MTACYRALCLSALLADALAGAAGAAWPGTEPGPGARTETVRAGPVEIRLTAEPGRVRLDRDLILTIRTRAPEGTAVGLPPLDDRLAGFLVAGRFERDAGTEPGFTLREHCFRLTPVLAEEYRLAPLAVTVQSPSNAQPSTAWVATPALRFNLDPLDGPAPGAARAPRGPIRILPGWREAGLWMLAAMLAAGLAWILWRAARRVRRAVRLRRLSPRERALAELAGLMARGLVANNQMEAFFVALTLIVRRYIERAHAIRAPEQTTGEFLAAAAADTTRFQPGVLRALKAFLETADLVKFAAYRPEPGVAEQALDTARNYIETDAAGSLADPNPGGAP